MTEKELIEQARANLGMPEIDSVEDAVIAFHGHGVADEQSGQVEAPYGHVIRVDRWIVRTDERGFNVLEVHSTEDLARVAFAEYDAEYVRWANACPYDNVDCPNPDAPIGQGLHAECVLRLADNYEQEGDQ
jgi:hypothetical protein